MEVDLEVLDPTTDAERWDRLVDRANGVNPLYRAAAIREQAEATGTHTHLLVGRIGQEPIGLFPVFEYSRGPVAAAFSPPPRSWSCYLGPAMVGTAALRRRTVDRRTDGFLTESLDWINEQIGPIYSKYVLTLGDVRPFLSSGFDAEPALTYVVQLDCDEEELLDRFSRDARNKLSGTDVDTFVEEGDEDAVEQIVEQVSDRYAAQGRPFHADPAYVRSLYTALGPDRLRPYVCRADGSFCGGILVLDAGSTRYRWLGGVKPTTDVSVPVNELLDWQVMRDGLANGVNRYDLVGAGVSGINEYKAKFNPDIEPYYTVTAGSYGVDLLIDRYRKPG